MSFLLTYANILYLCFIPDFLKKGLWNKQKHKQLDNLTKQ